MTQLVLLKRSDANLVLLACCEDMEHAVALAAELSNMQAFNVAVLACMPTLGAFEDQIHKALAAQHIKNRWYAASPSEVLQVASCFFDASQRVPIAEAELEKVNAGWPEPQKEIKEIQAGSKGVACEAAASLTGQAIESVAPEIHAATQEDSQNEELEKEEGACRLRQSTDAASEDAATLLVPCAKGEAGSARSITEALQKRLGRDAAASLLKRYKQAVMRDCEGKNTRYWLDATGSTVKLACPAAAAAEPWRPNLRLEEAYEDLSDASSIDGNESPAHKEVKEYSQARRFAREIAAETLVEEGTLRSLEAPDEA